MAAAASFDQSHELGLAAVAHLFRYRGTSREQESTNPIDFALMCLRLRTKALAAQPFEAFGEPVEEVTRIVCTAAMETRASSHDAPISGRSHRLEASISVASRHARCAGNFPGNRPRHP